MLIVLDLPEAEAYAAGFTVLLLRRAGAGFSLQGPDGGVLDDAPQAALAVIVPSGAKPPLLQAVRVWAAGQRLEAPVVAHGDGLAALLGRLAGRQAETARRSTELRLQLAELRLAHEALQLSQGALARLVLDQGIALPRLGFANPPDLGVSVTAADLVQPIPVDIRTLCGVSLHFPQAHQGGFTLELIATEDDQATARHDIPPTAFAAGWTTLVFEPRLLPAPGGAAIRLRWVGKAPPLSLGRITLRPERAAIAGGVQGDRGLALRAFVTTPGASVAVTDAMQPAVRVDRAPITRIDVTLDGAMPLLDPRGLNRQFHFQPVAAQADGRCILVHPLGALPTVALLPGLCPTGTREVTVRVETANPAAGPIEYAIHVMTLEARPPDDTAWAALANTLEWTSLPPCTEALLALELAAKLERPADLLLLTRLAPEGQSSSCWAHFTRITLFGRFSAGGHVQTRTPLL